MASRRPGSQTFGWPGNTKARDPRAGAEIPEEAAKLNARWTTRRGAEASLRSMGAIPQPAVSSRLPQALSNRRPSDSQPEEPRFVQHSRIKGSVGSARGLVVGDADGTSSSTLASSRLPAPSLKPRNILRRKRSWLSQDAGSTHHDLRNDSTGTTSSDSYPRSQTPLELLQLDRELTQSPMEIRVAQQVEIPMTKAQTVTIYPELDRYRDVKPPARSESAGSNLPYRIATHDLPPPTPLFSGTSSQLSVFSGSPSTRWSESPGPGPYSRDTTPTSISSQSPGLVAPIRIPPPGTRIRQADPNSKRPPVHRTRAGSISKEAGTVIGDPQSLAAVKELSSSSSSSNSTVRAGESNREKKSKVSARRRPSPPPRKSSQKSQESQDDGVAYPSKSSREAALPQASSSAPKITSYSRPRPVQAGRTAASPQPTPPVRPSREGTVDLQTGEPIPIVQSNLSSTSLSERRQSGLLLPGPVSRPSFPSSLPERASYPVRRTSVTEPNLPPQPAASKAMTDTSKQGTARPSRTPSPSVSTLKTRFPIFGRRTKTVPEHGQPEKKEKPTRKGPAAGTGHEGYGRLGSARRRSNSVTNTTRVIPGTMSSQESLSSSLTQDPFLMERTAPVIIAGGEVIENRNTSTELTRTETNQSSTFRRPSIDSRNSSQVSLSSREAPRKTLWSSPFPRGATPVPSLSSRRPSESSDPESLAMRPTLAVRRSMQRLQSGGQEPPRLPKPIVTRSQVVSPSLTSLDASILSDDSIFDPSAELAVIAKETATTATVSGPKKLVKRARSPRKWNLFGRSQNQPATEKKTETAKTVAATVKAVQSKPMAFYTMMDSSEQDDVEPVDLEEILREARGIAITTPEQHPVVDPETLRTSVKEDPAPQELARSQQVEDQQVADSKGAVAAPSTLPVPSVPERKPDLPLAQQPGNKAQPTRHGPGRPSRLPQVGRIPKVVSARAEQISPKSFSRPFHPLSAQFPPVQANLQDEDSVARGPSPPKTSTTHPADEDLVPANPSNISALIYGVPRLLPPVSSQAGQEFLSFSPRKDSQCTTTTSSSSSGGLLSYADVTAIVPEPNAPLAEDEIWDEYNDLLGDETVRLPVTQGSSWPKPLRLDHSTFGDRKLVETALESPTLSPPPLPSLVQALRSGMEHASLSVRGSDIAEEVKRMLEIDPLPEHPATVSAPLSSQDDQLHGVNRDMKADESRSSEQRNSAFPVNQIRRSDASGSTQCSEDGSPQSQVNLRVGSMTVSKWLTFGHVLFSPVRDELIAEVGSLKRPSILVVDGLGNDDWSFYAAETYPEATFFNLSPRAPLPAEHRKESSFPLSPPNHHQVQYLTHTAKFPFGAQSFTAVVFRFPAAAPEGHYRNIISEARRVLKPGGYIELSILDVDMNNMGNRCRRSVRRLKERIHARAPDTSLAPASDLILRLIGRRGFTDIKSCRVGVPVASIIARSPSGRKRSSLDPAAGGQGKTKPSKDERSLPEMINDESPVADESIAQSVTKVGRWWYSRCYENAAVPGIGPSSRASMWHDKALLAECEEWGTSLKLMVCHARAPDGRARVASI